MKAVILAAGMGKRLKDITLNTPKPLLKIANTTIIHYLVSCLKEIGIKDIYVVTGFKSKMIKKELGNLVNYIHNKKFKTTNSIYSLYLAKKYLQNSDFILANGDILLSKTCLSKVVRFKSSGEVEYIFVNPIFRKRNLAKKLLKLVREKTQKKIIFQKPISPLGSKLLKSIEKWN